jgi:hypothetical protein
VLLSLSTGPEISVLTTEIHQHKSARSFQDTEMSRFLQEAIVLLPYALVSKRAPRTTEIGHFERDYSAFLNMRM